jgi:hypothetical protein
VIRFRQSARAWRLPMTAALVASACGGAEAPPARTVFDPTVQGTNIVAVGSVALERPLPILDVAASGASESLVGVSVLNDAVRFSRPARWTIRDASDEPGHRFIRYVSPHAYSFAIYETSDAPTDSWHDILERYEVDVVAAGAKAVGRRIAVATNTNQGRAYTVERKVEAMQARSRSREIVLRGDLHVVLVQVVTEEDGLSRIGAEVLEVLKRLEVR